MTTTPLFDTTYWRKKLSATTKFKPVSDPANQDIQSAVKAGLAAANTDEWSYEIHYATDKDPVVMVYLTDTKETWRAHIPANAQPSNDLDKTFVWVHDGVIRNLWNANRSADGKTITASYGDGGGITGSGWHGSRAPGANGAAGLITAADWAARVIAHKLAVSGTKQMISKTFIPPAWNMDWDGNTHTGNIPYGSVAGIPMSVNVETLPYKCKDSVIIARAMQQYGVAFVDTAANFPIYGEPSLHDALEPVKQDLAMLYGLLRVLA